MKTSLISLIVGILFALGLGISGMTQPQKVIGFLNIFGVWDPSLLFVMAGAVGFHFVTYRIIRKRQTPFFERKWHVPTSKDISMRLIIGAVLFGAGWGLAGYCPGPAVTSLISGQKQVLLFVSSMIFGMLIFKWVENKLPSKI